MAFLNEQQILALVSLFNGEMISALAARAARPMVENGGRDEAPFATGLIAAYKRGNATPKQLGHIVRLHQAYCKHVNHAPKGPIAPVVNDILVEASRLGAGAFRVGFKVRQTANLIIKIGQCREGRAHCQLEADTFANAGKHTAWLAPCWIENDRLYMFKVSDYQNGGTFQLQSDGTYKHSECGRSITVENYIGLKEACKALGALWDCHPDRRTQGGWIGDRFVMTDYAL